MNYWPRLILDDWEKRQIVKYNTPIDNRQSVKRKMYPGFLELTENNRLPTFPLNIARRAKIFGITFAGDIQHFRLTITDSAGEQFVANPIHIPHLQPGYVQNAIGNYTPDVAAGYPLAGYSQGPHIFNPAILLRPNQTVTFAALENEPAGFNQSEPTNVYRVDFTVHVWEYPGMDGGAI